MRGLRAILLPALLAWVVVFAAAPSFAQVAVSVAVAPPPLPIYVQPPIPGPGYLWTPGYWGYRTAGYYWVPGTWVRPPSVGLLWTPGYWGRGGAAFVFHAGYWGPRVGFYGGINYGFGYAGVGFAGGYWAHGALYYNRAVNNFGNTHITNVYNRTVTVNRTTNVSYNGGAGGTTARPTAAELAAARERRAGPTAAQVRQRQTASGNRALLASENHGNPPIAATRRAGEFTGHGVEAARGAAVARPAAGPEHRPAAGTEHRAATRATTERANRGPQAKQEHPYARPEARSRAPEQGAHHPLAARRGPRQPAEHRPAEQGQTYRQNQR
jgi:WXXGXW repeat (2 copies)